MPLRSLWRKPISRIETGTYTGDGTTAQAITGVGFRPMYVVVWPHETTATQVGHSYKSDTMEAALCVDVDLYGNTWKGASDRIISLDADGFTVDDAGADQHPNKLNQLYDYMALG